MSALVILENSPGAIRGIVFMVEREGFEPSIPFSGYTRFPIVLFRPLRHLSRESYLSFAGPAAGRGPDGRRGPLGRWPPRLGPDARRR